MPPAGLQPWWKAGDADAAFLQSPWAALVGAMVALAIIVLSIAFARKHSAENVRVFSMDDDLATERASQLLRQWRLLNRAAAALMAAALLLTLAPIARPATVDQGEERASSRDIVLCLDVSGSTLPYDREVIDTYRDLELSRISKANASA